MGVAKCEFSNDPPRRRDQREEREQMAVFSWASLFRLPDGADIEPGAMLSDYLFAIPNGGRRDAIEAARMRRAGVKAGVSDMYLPLARWGYHGLWIELKAGKGRMTEPQALWQRCMTRAGYRAVTCRGWEAVKAIIEEYLGNA